jgi:hypothetical protein
MRSDEEMELLKRAPYQEQRDWLLHALLNAKVTITAAAKRLAAVDEAWENDEPCPDIRNPDPHWIP